MDFNFIGNLASIISLILALKITYKTKKLYDHINDKTKQASIELSKYKNIIQAINIFDAAIDLFADNRIFTIRDHSNLTYGREILYKANVINRNDYNKLNEHLGDDCIRRSEVIIILNNYISKAKIIETELNVSLISQKY